MKKFVLILILLSIGTSGCGLTIFSGLSAAGTAASAAVSGYIFWKNGEAQKYYQYDSVIMRHAVERALKKLNLPIKENKEVKPVRDKYGANYYLYATSNSRFKIKVYSTEKGITKVSIRVNTLGDKPYATLIYEEIDRQASVIDFRH